MRWTRIAGFVFVFGLVAACNLSGKTPNQCQTDDQCKEGEYCDVGRALCIMACEKAGCLEGHFCDPDSHFCKDYCPHACPALPVNATLVCGDVCEFTCNPGSHSCGEQCPLDTDATACGASCTACPTDNGAATCNDGVCGYACNGGFYDNGGTCVANEVTHCCGSAGCVDCTASGTVSGMSCGEGGVCAQTEPFSRNTSVLGEPTVKGKDNPTLIWQGCPEGVTGDNCDSGTPIRENLADDAASYCTKLFWGNRADWYLPDIGELKSIMLNPCPSSSYLNPILCIDTAAFPPITPASPTYSLAYYFFWSSSSVSGNASSVNFGYNDSGEFDGSPGSMAITVRCVRYGP